MVRQELFHHGHEYATLHIHEDAGNGALWCHMHARSAADEQPYRPCFSTQLLAELREFQHRAAAWSAAADAHEIRHLVLASAADVFNLGGDLDLFCRLIRTRDRERLLDYAHRCVAVACAFRQRDDLHSIALVQGDALGGGFEAALCCHTIVAESGVGMGFPEVLFDLFPGMGAYSFLRQRISASLAEQMMLDGNVYSSDELHRMGVVDVLVPRGEGVAAVEDLIARHRRIGHARMAMNRVKATCFATAPEELTTVTEIWVDTALQLGEKSLRTMERLVRAQLRRPERRRARMEAMPLQIAG